MISLPTDPNASAAAIRSVAESMSKGRWDYGVQKACAWRARLGIQ
jgi:hypothetical protein